MEKLIISYLGWASVSVECVGQIVLNQYKQPVFSLSWEESLENTKNYGGNCPGVHEYG